MSINFVLLFNSQTFNNDKSEKINLEVKISIAKTPKEYESTQSVN